MNSRPSSTDSMFSSGGVKEHKKATDISTIGSETNEGTDVDCPGPNFDVHSPGTHFTIEWKWKITIPNTNNKLTEEALKLKTEEILKHFNEEYSKDPNSNNTGAVLHDICVTNTSLMIEFVVKKERYNPNIEAFKHIVQRCLKKDKQYIFVDHGRLKKR